MTPGRRLGLAERNGADALERLLHLAAQAADGAIVEPRRDAHGFGALHPRDGAELLAEVARVFDLGFDGARLVAGGGAGQRAIVANPTHRPVRVEWSTASEGGRRWRLRGA